MRRRNWTIPYALFLAVFVVMPLLLIVLYAFTDKQIYIIQHSLVPKELGYMFYTDNAVGLLHRFIPFPY